MRMMRVRACGAFLMRMIVYLLVFFFVWYYTKLFWALWGWMSVALHRQHTLRAAQGLR